MSDKRNLHIGCHLSSAEGFLSMGKEAVKLDADVFAFFTRNPRAAAPRNSTLRILPNSCPIRKNIASARSSPMLPIR